MNPLAVLFFVVNAAALVIVPRATAFVPLLLGCSYMTIGQGIVIAGINLPLYRMLLGVGLCRVLLRRERPVGGLNRVDILIVSWGAWNLFASFFHDGALGSGPVFISGIVLNIGLFYFLVRIFCGASEDVVPMVGVIAIVLFPLALEMMQERITGHNAFAIFGGVPETVMVRLGRLRAQGPFRHPILAGTVGAACFPMMFALWEAHRAKALIGMLACMLMVLASASSGPAMSLAFGIFALGLWQFQRVPRILRFLALPTYLVLEVLMNRPAYYVISKFDLAGGSTGWHRARLIEATIEHVSEWWLFGTDVTRHWMPTGVTWSAQHTDITSYYIQIAVWGGGIALVLMIAALWQTFGYVSEVINADDGGNTSRSFIAWCLGASLFAQAASAISVSYFDQSMLFFWAVVAMIGSMHSSVHGEILRRPGGEQTSDCGQGLILLSDAQVPFRGVDSAKLCHHYENA